MPDTRKALLEALYEKGYGDAQLAEMAQIVNAEQSDVFDVLAYVAFNLPPITRQERAGGNRERILVGHNDKLQAFLDFVLSQYVKEGVGELDQAKLPDLLELKYRTVSDAATQLGNAAQIREAFIGFQRHLYEEKTID